MSGGSGSFQKSYTLARRIAAVRLTNADGHRRRLGEIAQLPAGVRLDCCGGGFDERTVKVHYAGEFYFVFLQDLFDAVER